MRIETKHIVSRLIEARKKAGLSQLQAAVLMGHASSSTICHVETGRTELSVEVMLRLCEFYNVSPVWVLTGTDMDFDPASHVASIQASIELAKQQCQILEALL